jgi:hypothetical protein
MKFASFGSIAIEAVGRVDAISAVSGLGRGLDRAAVVNGPPRPEPDYLVVQH